MNFFDPRTGTSGLPFNPFKAFCVPRPIGWISTLSREGIPNLAPFSQFQNLTWDPPTVLVAVNCRPDGSLKDTAANAIQTGEFGWSMATERHFDEVVLTGHELDPSVNEFDYAGLKMKRAKLIKPPLVEGSPAHFECVLKQSIFFPGGTPEAGTHLLVGEVIGIHFDPSCLTEGMLDVRKLRPLARLGYVDFAVIREPEQPPGERLPNPESIAFLRERPPG